MGMDDQKSFSSHLKIDIGEYDDRVLTFIPYYLEMLDEVERLAGLYLDENPTVLDLGVGTGAVSERCLRLRPEANITGIDSDSEMLEGARVRLKAAKRIDLICESFLDVEFPEADLIGGTLSIHHVPDPTTKQELYRRCMSSLRPGGVMLLADCFPPRDETLADRGWAEWRSHLESHYTPDETTAYFEAWSGEDTHFSLDDELDWLGLAGFRAQVTWRKDLFAVICCT